MVNNVLKSLYEWDKDRTYILRKIAETYGDFKICIKVKNEKELLPDLLSHLLRAGFSSEEIIIFDNTSDDREFLEYLDKISERFLVVKYSGDHNSVHEKKFSDLHKAIAQSSKYFMFLDADEFPFLMDLRNGGLKIDNFKNSLIKYLDEINEDYDTFWLIYPGYPTLFVEIPSSIYDNLIWSKPLFKSKNILNNDKFMSGKWDTPYIAHLINAYLAGCKVYPKYLPALLVHDKFKYPQRTVRINSIKILRVEAVQDVINDLIGKEFTAKINYSDIEKIAKFLVDNKNKILDKLSDVETYNYVNRNISEIEKALSTENIENTNKLYDVFDSFVRDNKDLLEILTKSKIFYGLPHMSFKENIYLYNILREKSTYLEYGSGMSTIFAMNYCNNVISVDNHPDWYGKVNGYISELKQLPFYESVNVYHEFIYTGNVGDWGMPMDEKGWKMYHKYILAPWKIAFKYNINPDIILIDGRWRVASFLLSLYFAKEGVTILFHDYKNRPHYHIVEEYIKPAEIIDTLAVFKKEKSINMDIKILEYILRYINFAEGGPKPSKIQINKLIRVGNTTFINIEIETYKPVKSIDLEGNCFNILKNENSNEISKIELVGYLNNNLAKDEVEITIYFIDNSKQTVRVKLIEGFKKYYFEIDM